MLTQERQSAEQIVAAACAFGQEDDITVLSEIRRLAADEPGQGPHVSHRADCYRLTESFPAFLTPER